jgi:hypothetical protein
MLNNALLLSLLLVTVTLTLTSAGGLLTGGFTLSSQLTSKKRKALEALNLSLYDEKVYGVWSKESEEFSLNAVGISDGDKAQDSSTLLQVVYRVLRGSGVFIDPEDKSKAATDMKTCVIELPQKIIGRNTYILKNTRETLEVEENIDDDLIVELEYWSPKLEGSSSSKIQQLPKSLRLKVQIMLQGGEMTVSVKTSATGLSKSTVLKVMKVTRKFWQTQLESEVQLAISRRRQSQIQSQISKSAEKEKNAKRLDRVAYPEKYKQQSPSVRKTGGVATYSSSSATGSGSSGSGRYKPGAAAAARQVMRKGG